MSESRLPTHLVVSGLVRQISAEGGMAAVLAKGDRDSGTLVLLLRDRAGMLQLLERRPSADFNFEWQVTREEDAEKAREIYDYCDRRAAQDDDLWIVEADVADPERLIAQMRA